MDPASAEEGREAQWIWRRRRRGERPSGSGVGGGRKVSSSDAGSSAFPIGHLYGREDICVDILGGLIKLICDAHSCARGTAPHFRDMCGADSSQNRGTIRE